MSRYSWLLVAWYIWLIAIVGGVICAFLLGELVRWRRALSSYHQRLGRHGIRLEVSEAVP